LRDGAGAPAPAPAQVGLAAGLHRPAGMESIYSRLEIPDTTLL